MILLLKTSQNLSPEFHSQGKLKNIIKDLLSDGDDEEEEMEDEDMDTLVLNVFLQEYSPTTMSNVPTQKDRFSQTANEMNEKNPKKFNQLSSVIANVCHRVVKMFVGNAALEDVIADTAAKMTKYSSLDNKKRLFKASVQCLRGAANTSIEKRTLQALLVGSADVNELRNECPDLKLHQGGGKRKKAADNFKRMLGGGSLEKQVINRARYSIEEITDAVNFILSDDNCAMFSWGQDNNISKWNVLYFTKTCLKA